MHKLFISLVVVGLTACGPDVNGLAGVNESDVDALATTTDDALSSSNSPATWLPMAEGNVWSFESSTGARVIKLTGVTTTMAKLEGLYDSAVWIGTSGTSASTLYAWSDDKNDWVPFIRFGYSTTSWTYGTGACTTQKMKRSGTGVTVSGKAGSFADTRVIASELVTQPSVMCAAPAFSELSFAADTGLVAFKTGRGEKFTLVSATVNGKRIPNNNGSVAATATLDKKTYTNVPNTIRCVTTPCPSNALTADADLTFKVTNNTRSTFTWKTSNACQFDVDVRSATGTLIKRLSDTRTCAAGATTLTLAAGASKTFTAEIHLQDRDALQLDGEYTMTARVLGTGGPATSATANLAVTIKR